MESLLEQYFILVGPFVWERCEVGQVHDGAFQIVFVPEQHTQRLFAIVAVLFFGDGNVLL